MIRLNIGTSPAGGSSLWIIDCDLDSTNLIKCGIKLIRNGSSFICLSISRIWGLKNLTIDAYVDSSSEDGSPPMIRVA